MASCNLRSRTHSEAWGPPKKRQSSWLLIYGVRSRIAGVKAKQLSGRRSVSATALTLGPLLDLFYKFFNVKRRFVIHDAYLHSAHGNGRKNLKHRVVQDTVPQPR